VADMVRTKRHTLRPVAGDSVQTEAIKVVTRSHKTLIWERTRHLLRLRHVLREFFPAGRPVQPPPAEGRRATQSRGWGR